MKSISRTMNGAESSSGARSARESAAGAATRAGVQADGHAALVQATQRGDHKAFATLLDLYQNTVFGFLRARLAQPSDAEDLCQEVFLRCYLGREKLHRAAAIGPWLIGIARNLLHEEVRRRQQRKEVAWTELCLKLDDLVARDPAEANSAVAQLPACLESLGQSAREAIDMKYRSQLRIGEIATRLCRSEGAVKLLVHRARQALKNCLDRKLKAAP
jgi:RNA polymerase sigma-70 factor (ECF subfamily)